MKKILKLFKKTKEEPIKEIKLDDLEIWFTNKKLKSQKFTKEINEEIKLVLFAKIKIFLELIEILKGVKVDSINERERIKSIVKENLSNYIKNLDRLISELKELNNEQDLMRKLNEKFYNFEKKTKINYAKATYLIGKELGDVKQTIDDLFNEINKVVKRNQDEFEEQKKVALLETKLKGFHEIEELKRELKLKLRKIISQYDEESEKKDLILMEIEKLKKSEEYKKESEKREVQDLLKKTLEQEIKSLKNEIDFKLLAHHYHKSEKDMSTINAFKDNWSQKFKEGNGEYIFTLLKQINKSNSRIEEKLERIMKIKSDISSTTLSDIGLAKLELDLEKINLAINDATKEKHSIEKLIEKQSENLNNSISEINEELLNFNYTIVTKTSPKNI